MAEKNAVTEDQTENTAKICGNSDRNEDPELDDLLDSALDDFDKPSVKAHSNSEIAATVSPTNSNVESAWSEEFMQQTQDVESAFRNLMGKDAESLQDFQKFASIFNKPGGDANDTDFLSNLSAGAQSFAEQQGPSLSDEELSKMLGSIGLNPSDPSGDESSADVSSMVQNMMQMLLSKDLLYPALRDITDKYPNWLLENKETTAQEQFSKYQTQYEIMQKICSEFESESETDTPETKKSRFEQILEMMQKMQDCGNPPTSLVGVGDGDGDGSAGLEFDENGVPKIPGLAGLGLGLGNEKCQIM